MGTMGENGMSKYDYPGERLLNRCGECGGPLFRDIDDSLWCPACEKKRFRAHILEKLRNSAEG